MQVYTCVPRTRRHARASPAAPLLEGLVASLSKRPPGAYVVVRTVAAAADAEPILGFVPAEELLRWDEPASLPAMDDDLLLRPGEWVRVRALGPEEAGQWRTEWNATWGREVPLMSLRRALLGGRTAVRR